jgi:hypothetical protein
MDQLKFLVSNASNVRPRKALAISKLSYSPSIRESCVYRVRRPDRGVSSGAVWGCDHVMTRFGDASRSPTRSGLDINSKSSTPDRSATSDLLMTSARLQTLAELSAENACVCLTSLYP